MDVEVEVLSDERLTEWLISADTATSTCVATAVALSGTDHLDAYAITRECEKYFSTL